MTARSKPLALQYFADLQRDVRQDNNANLNAWLWFTCPANMREIVRAEILERRKTEAGE